MNENDIFNVYDWNNKIQNKEDWGKFIKYAVSDTVFTGWLSEMMGNLGINFNTEVDGIRMTPMERSMVDLIRETYGDGEIRQGLKGMASGSEAVDTYWASSNDPSDRIYSCDVILFYKDYDIAFEMEEDKDRGLSVRVGGVEKNPNMEFLITNKKELESKFYEILEYLSND